MKPGSFFGTLYARIILRMLAWQKHLAQQQHYGKNLGIIKKEKLVLSDEIHL